MTEPEQEPPASDDRRPTVRLGQPLDDEEAPGGTIRLGVELPEDEDAAPLGTVRLGVDLPPEEPEVASLEESAVEDVTGTIKLAATEDVTGTIKVSDAEDAKGTIKLADAEDVTGTVRLPGDSAAAGPDAATVVPDDGEATVVTEGPDDAEATVIPDGDTVWPDGTPRGGRQPGAEETHWGDGGAAPASQAVDGPTAWGEGSAEDAGPPPGAGTWIGGVEAITHADRRDGEATHAENVPASIHDPHATRWSHDGSEPPGPRRRAGLNAQGPKAGEAFGDYDLEDELGRGGMGVVFRALERASGRAVALKVILLGKASDTMRKRFLREGQVMASLRHPGIVNVHTAGDVGGQPFLACELVEGARQLSDAWTTMPARERALLLVSAARALGYAHANDVVHRDVKPGNILLDADGRLRVADFGLAFSSSDDRLTKTGAVLGTPAYMAPEQISGERSLIGAHTDVWSLGVILYRALTDQVPFRAAGVAQLTTEILRVDPPPPSQLSEDVDPALEAVCLKALAKLPGDRYPDGEAMARDLERALKGERLEAAVLRAPRRRARPLLAVALLLVGALAGAWWFSKSRAGAGTSRAGPDTKPPRIFVTEPRLLRSTTSRPEVTLRGSVRDDSPCELRLNGQRIQLRADGSFERTLDLRPGETELRLEAVDSAGNEARPQLRRVTWSFGPGWFQELHPSKRPPWPLPEGLSVRSREGEYRWEADGSILVWVPPATFPAGAESFSVNQSVFNSVEVRKAFGRQNDTRRTITLTNGYFIGKHEVTWDQWRHYKRESGQRVPAPYVFHMIVTQTAVDGFRIKDGQGNRFEAPGDHPAVEISWDAAKGYLDWAGLRFPTQAEWELAARGLDGRTYPWGDELPDGTRLNMLGLDDRYEFTAPVGSFPAGASPYGCLDMAGNVWEWTQDWAGPAGTGHLTDPVGTTDSGFRVQVGGSWAYSWTHAFTTHNRTGRPPWDTNQRSGFRVCLSPRN